MKQNKLKKKRLYYFIDPSRQKTIDARAPGSIGYQITCLSQSSIYFWLYPAIAKYTEINFYPIFEPTNTVTHDNRFVTNTRLFICLPDFIVRPGAMRIYKTKKCLRKNSRTSWSSLWTVDPHVLYLETGYLLIFLGQVFRIRHRIFIIGVKNLSCCFVFELNL